MEIRESRVSDIGELVELWKETGLYFAPFDKEERLREKIEKEPELLLVAEDKDKIIGAVIGNYGWRVSIDHLAVDEQYRKQDAKNHVGKQLLEEIKKNLKERGATVALIDSNLPRRLLERVGCKYRGNYSNYTIKI